MAASRLVIVAREARRENEYDSDRRGREVVAAERYADLVKGSVVDRSSGRL